MPTSPSVAIGGLLSALLFGWQANACPVAADLARGIVVVMSDGTAWEYRSGAGDMVTARRRDADGGGMLELARGQFWVQETDQRGRRASEWVYVEPLSTLPDPAPGAVWTSDAYYIVRAARTLTDRDGWPTVTPRRLEWTGETELEIGGCPWQVVEGTLTNLASGFSDRLAYFADLGFSVSLDDPLSEGHDVAFVGVKAK